MLKNVRNYIKDNNYKLTLKNNIIDIENYTNIGNITEKEITIYINNLKILIKGNKLHINKLLNNEILIIGNYNNIIFEGINE